MLSRREWIASLALAPLLSAQNSSFLSPEQTQTLASLGECIIPGSAAAQCPQTIDLILGIESAKNQQMFTDALGAFKNFADLGAAAQTELLTKAAVSGNELNRPFQTVKEWVADTYWSSKAGLKDLGWTGQMAWREFKGCPR
jgi:hypothetical protein